MRRSHTTPRKRWSWKKRIGLLLGAGFLLLVGLVGVGYALTTVPQPSSVSLAQASTITWADGSRMGTLGTNRVLVGLDKISDPAQKAVLAAEDRGYYSEPGISPKGIARAIFTNVKGGGVEQGGSTITQQYAKNAFLTQQRTFSRKIKEAFIAVKLSQTKSKATVLEDYLNTIYFGRGAYGIQAASETYFGTPAANLTASQAAVLASSIRSPSGYDPTKHPAAAKARWAYVLDGMVKKGWLTAEARASATYPTVSKPGSTTAFPGPWSSIRDQVLADLAAHGFSEAQVEAGGLTVRTTIKQDVEQQAVAAVQAKVPAGGADAPVAALVSVEPGTGAVRAYYGNRDTGGFDYADNTGRGVQPGSSMKPYVLATALENGKTLGTTYDGASHQDICGQKDVKNDAGDPSFGQVSLTTGLEYSINTVYVRLACDVGPDKVAALAHLAGIPDTQPLADDTTHKPTQQIALGSGGYEVHPLDQADGYATIAGGGKQAAPYFVDKVVDSHHRTLYTAKPVTRQAFSADVAANVLVAMQKVVSGGTGTRAQLAGGRPTAGKTGTTSNNGNAWFIGVTPQLSTAVWVGRPSGGPLTGVLGRQGGLYGGTVPAEVFKQFMDSALTGAPQLPFPQASSNTGGGSGPTSAPGNGYTYSPRPSSSPQPTSSPTSGGLPLLPTRRPSASPAPTKAPAPSRTPVPVATSAAPAPTSSP